MATSVAASTCVQHTRQLPLSVLKSFFTFLIISYFCVKDYIFAGFLTVYKAAK